MNHDPILDSISVYAHRALVFILFFIFQSVAIWLWLVHVHFAIDFANMRPWLDEALPPARNQFAEILLYGCLVISMLNTTILYLVIGKWWGKRANVQHYRGARLDSREA